MTHSLTFSHSLEDELRRLTALELDEAIEQLSTDHESVEERIHETRKAIKRLRSLLRLFSGALEHTTRDREDEALRAVARSLGAARDAVALHESLEALVRAAREEARVQLADHLPLLEAALGGGADPNAAETDAAIRAASDALRAMRERSTSWPVRHHGWSTLSRGFRTTYARGRRALERALGRPNATRLHALRIQAKRHQHQLTLFEPLWPEPIKSFRQEAQRLGELLGHHHDLWLLGERLATLALRPELARAVAVAKSAAETRHAELEQQALELAKRLYTEPPSGLAARYRGYLGAWRDERSDG